MANETKTPAPETTDPEDAALLKEVDDSLRLSGSAPTPEAEAATEAEIETVTAAEKPAVEAPWRRDDSPSEVKPAKAAASEPPGPTPTVPPSRRGGAAVSFLALLVGGALCVGAGYVLGERGLLNTPRIVAAENQISALSAEVASLKSAVAERPAPVADPALAARLSALEEAEAAAPQGTPDAALTDRLSELEARIAAVQSAPAAPAADPALASELASLKAQVEGLQAGGGAAVQEALAAVQQKLDAASTAADEISTRAAAAGQQALATAALGRIRAALDSGLPYGSALADLGPAVGDAMPAVLAEAAEAGLPTLNTLRDRFPEAARAGIEAALTADPGASWGQRIGNFLRAQTAARSLSPREGADADAVLSRAEAALAAGDAAGALAGVKSLPEAAQAAMAPWIALAEQRLAAEAALADLATKLEG